MTTFPGRRVHPAPDGPCLAIHAAPGDYWIEDGRWYGMTPNGLLAGLAKHQVAEHEDGTITVSPSIKTWNDEAMWHGYLERGVWREC